MLTPKLKLCQFCRGEGVIFNSGNHWPKVYYKVICNTGCCAMSAFVETPEEAAAMWNRRASDENA